MSSESSFRWLVPSGFLTSCSEMLLLEVTVGYLDYQTSNSKYVGTSQKDLVDIYVLFIRSVAEYCSVSFHSSLTQEQSRTLERIQRTCVKVILGEYYVSYKTALQSLGLESLEERRTKRCLDFSLKCLKHPRNRRLFPRNLNSNIHNLRGHDIFIVNFANTSCYQKSAFFNEHF